MVPKSPSKLRQLWFTWKTMKLPWRKEWLVGYDLEGNTFWEFKDQMHAQRNRRIVKPSVWTHHGDVKVPVQWSQWLRHTRFEPPTLSELQSDVMRQERMKVLAAQADARWAAKPSAMDAPDKQQPAQMLESRDPSSGIHQSSTGHPAETRAEPLSILNSVEEISGDRAGADTQERTLKKPKKRKSESEDNPWKQAARGNPGDEWQPEKWTPAPAKRRS